MTRLMIRLVLTFPRPARRALLLPFYRLADRAYNRHWGLNTFAMGDDYVFRAGGVDQHCLELHEFRRGALFRQTYWFDRDEGRRELGL